MTDEEDLLKLDNQVCFALVTAARNGVSIYRPILEPLGRTHPQYLADELAMEPATLSPLVKRLETQGRVTRTRRTDDERVLDIGLTPAGRVLREEALEVPRRVMAVTGLGAAELKELRDGLQPVAGRMPNLAG